MNKQLVVALFLGFINAQTAADMDKAMDATQSIRDMLSKSIKAGMTAADGATDAAGMDMSDIMDQLKGKIGDLMEDAGRSTDAAKAAMDGMDTADIMNKLKGKFGDIMKGADRSTIATDAARDAMAGMDPAALMDMVKSKMGGTITDLMREAKNSTYSRKEHKWADLTFEEFHEMSGR